MSLIWKYKCWLYPQSIGRLSALQKEEFKQTGKVPISIRIECNGERTARGQGKRIQVSTKISCSPKLLHTLFPEFKPKKTNIDFNSTKTAREKNKELYSTLEMFLDPYKKCVDELNSDPKKYQHVKTRKQFLQFKKEKLSEITIIDQGEAEHKLMDFVEIYLKVKGNLAVKTEKNYKENIRHFCNYANNQDLTIWDIDYQFLVKWDKWAVKNLRMKSIETYGNHLKIILDFVETIIPEYKNVPITNKKSTLSNEQKSKLYKSLINDGYKNIVIPSQSQYIVKKAPKTSFKPNRYLDIDQIELLKKYLISGAAANDKEQKAIEVWFLMYYLAGCYPMDLVFTFKKSNFYKSKKYVEYQRHKTLNTRTTPEPIPIQLNNHAIELINIYKSDSKKTDLLFNFWEIARIPDNEGVNLGDRTTRDLKSVAKKLGFSQLNSKMARHSCFNRLDKLKTPFDEIQRVAGHTDPATTRIYLDGLKMVDLTETYAKL